MRGARSAGFTNTRAIWRKGEAMEMTATVDHPRVREALTCVLCQGRKDSGCVVCWACYRAHGLRDGLKPWIASLVRDEEARLTPPDPTPANGVDGCGDAQVDRPEYARLVNVYQEAIRAHQAADEALSTLLRARYGKRAGDMRYRPAETPEIADAMRVKLAAGEAQ